MEAVLEGCRDEGTLDGGNNNGEKRSVGAAAAAVRMQQPPGGRHPNENKSLFAIAHIPPPVVVNPLSAIGFS